MKNKNNLLLFCLAFLMTLCLNKSALFADQRLLGDADNNGTITLNDAQLALLCALGIDTSQESVLDVDGNGTVNLEDAQIILKVALGIEQIPAHWQSKPEENISYQTQKIKNGIVCIVKNNNSFVVDIYATAVFYKENAMIDTSVDTNYCLEPDAECALFFLAPYDLDEYKFIDYDDFKINWQVEEGSENLIYDSKNISVTSNMTEDNVTAEFKNNSNINFSTIHTTIVFYDAKGNIIDFEESYADCKISGSTDYITYYFPYDSSFKTIVPADYKIYIDSAYTYSWMEQ